MTTVRGDQLAQTIVNLKTLQDLAQQCYSDATVFQAVERASQACAGLVDVCRNRYETSCDALDLAITMLRVHW